MIIYGDYTCKEFNQIKGQEDPLFQEWLRQIKQLDWTDYQLWIYGGILEWDTYDIDGCILGPLDVTRINYLLDNIVRISYSLGIAPGIGYNMSNQLFDYNIDTKKILRHAYYRGSIRYNKKSEHFALLKDGLYQSVKVWPMSKGIKKLEQGYKYQSPKQII